MWSQGRGASNIWSLLCVSFMRVYICWTNKWRDCFLVLPAMAAHDLYKCPGMSHINESLYVFFFPPPGQNYCAVNNGGCTHLCLATPTGRSCKCPDNAVGVGCVERDWKEPGLRVDTVWMFWPQIRSHSALLNYSCWKCHWKPGGELTVPFIAQCYAYPHFYISHFIKITAAFENCKYKHYYFVFSRVHINWE